MKYKNKLPIHLNKSEGTDYFDEIVIGRFTRISFQRTLRIPEDGLQYDLPAGLGKFPIHRVEDYVDKVPGSWLEKGGFFIPLYQKEAMFIQFEGHFWHPNIAKVCVGRINAITGKPYTEDIVNSSQDYLMIPRQRWLDGIFAGQDEVKQFVAMPLGQGYTIEAQLTDEEIFGGFQICVWDSVEGRFSDREPQINIRKQINSEPCLYQNTQNTSSVMGIAAGGNIKQQIYADIYGAETWSLDKKRSIIVHMVNSLAYKSITGMDPPESPISIEEYQDANIPWYSSYDEYAPIIKPSSIFQRVIGVLSIDKRRGLAKRKEFERNVNIVEHIHKIKTPDKNEAVNYFRASASDFFERCQWHNALRDISYVIDFADKVDTREYTTRAICNFELGRYHDAKMDCTLAIETNGKCIEAIALRAKCFKNLQDYDGMKQDAEILLMMPESESLGLEIKAEAAFLSGNFDLAICDAILWGKKNPADRRVKNFLAKARKHASKKNSQ